MISYLIQNSILRRVLSSCMNQTSFLTAWSLGGCSIHRPCITKSMVSRCLFMLSSAQIGCLGRPGVGRKIENGNMPDPWGFTIRHSQYRAPVRLPFTFWCLHVQLHKRCQLALLPTTSAGNCIHCHFYSTCFHIKMIDVRDMLPYEYYSFSFLWKDLISSLYVVVVSSVSACEYFTANNN